MDGKSQAGRLVGSLLQWDRKELRISGIGQQLWDKKTVMRQFSEVEPTGLCDQLDMGLQREREGKKMKVSGLGD